MTFFDPLDFLMLAPAIVLGLWAQFRVKANFAEAEQVAASLSGADAARRVLDSAGLYNVQIESIGGYLSTFHDAQRGSMPAGAGPAKP